MSGFFKISQKTPPLKRNKVLTCYDCQLYEKVKTPRIAPYGNFRKRILNVGEAPGEMEDFKGRPFVGVSGKLLQKTYQSLGIDLFEDCLNINACACRPVDKNGNNRNASNFEIECCRNYIFNTIEEYKPHLIILLGGAAVYSILGVYWRHDSVFNITRWRGWQIPDRNLQAWICPTFHPSYIERSKTNKDVSSVESVIWENDLKQSFKLIETELPTLQEPTIEFIEDLTVLNNIQSDKIVIDFETSGLKPYEDGHRIECVAVADSPHHAYAFFLPKIQSQRIPFLNLLSNEKIKKIAHNMKFEHLWAKERLRVKIEGWYWDTMLMSHVLDNRPHITGLKFQTYIRFGVADYSSEVEKYLSSSNDERGANSFNNITRLTVTEEGRRTLLKYCALDVIYTFRLYEFQEHEISS